MSDVAVKPSTRPWPDLSNHGVTLGIYPVKDNEPSLVFIDELGKWGHVARNMGFAKSRVAGLWVRGDLRVEAASFRAAFPRVVVHSLTIDEIYAKTQAKVNQIVAASQQALLPGFDAVGTVLPDSFTARPAPTIKGRKADLASGDEGVDNSGPAAEEYVDISPLIAQARSLGMNRALEEVYEAPDGSRFVRFQVEGDTGMVDTMVREVARIGADDATAGRFLRGDSDGALAASCDAFVHLMAEGHTARTDELKRFFRAVTGREHTAEDPDRQRVTEAIDRARVRKLTSLSAVPDSTAFHAALRLHESAQYYSLVSGQRMTPLPVGVVLQRIAGSMPKGSSVRVDNALAGEFGSFTEEGSNFRPAADGERQDILLAAYDGAALDQSVEAFATAVSRNDHASVLLALQDKMSPNGLGLFVIEGDAVPGRIGPSSRRFLDALATHHEIEGIVDIDGNLMGVPGAKPSRLIVVGAKRSIPGHGGLPTALPFVTDYESLWGWAGQITEAIAKPGSVPYSDRGGVSKEATVNENVFQAPYIPASMLSDPTLMTPRNMASPLRRAMLKVLKDIPHPDEWLAKQLQKDIDQLKLSAEQADAVVMALHRSIDNHLGFLVSDQPGVGKGRVLAARVLAAKLTGQPIIFLTENSGLFSDFWRDLEDIGADDFFPNPLVLNDDTEIISTRTGEVVARSAERSTVDAVMRSMKVPKDVGIVFATYSQFNRDPIKAIEKESKIDLTGITRSQLSTEVRRLLASINQERAANYQKPMKELVVSAVDILGDPKLIQLMPLSAVKSLWIGKATKDALLVMDESHNASGEDSQTNRNLSHAVIAAQDIVYSSATFARGERSMRIYRRLLPKSVDVEELHQTLARGGEPLQEALSTMLAEDGALIRREHDLSMLTFEPKIDVKRTSRNEKLADQLAEILAAMTYLTRETRLMSDALSQALKDALVAEEVARTNNPKARVPALELAKVGVVKRTHIGNSLYMIMQGFIVGLKAEFAADEAIRHLREGRKPVLVISHTMEAELTRRLDAAISAGEAKKTDAGGWILKAPTFRDVLRDRLQDLFKLTLDGKDLEVTRDPRFAEVIRMIEGLIDKFPKMPTSPMDVIRRRMEDAGYKIAELSGRSKRVEFLPNGQIHVVPVHKNERKTAVDRFNNGDANGLLLTAAGNSGISVQDSYRFLNRGQRVLIEVEVPEDVVKRTQFFGRVHRLGQMTYPIIATLSSGLPAENRILAIQNNKLRKLSANITANRDNAALTQGIADVFNVVGNEVAYRFLETEPELAAKLDIDLEKLDAQVGESEDEDEVVSQLKGERYCSDLMNRMVALPVAQQRRIIDVITMEFDAYVAELDAQGRNPLRPKFFDINATKHDSVVLEVGATVGGDEGADSESPKAARSSAFDQPVYQSTLTYMHYYEPMPARKLIGYLKHGREGESNRFERIQEESSYKLWAQDNPDGEMSDFVIDYLVAQRAPLLETYKGTHASVPDALAAEKSNLVKIVNGKIDAIISTLSIMKSGSRIAMRLSDRGEVEDHCVVLGVFPPANPFDFHSPGRYSVSLAIPGNRETTLMSLSALLGNPDFKVMETEWNLAITKYFDSYKKGSFEVERQVVDGNLFRASEMSIQAGVGRQAYYSDQHGMMNRAVVLDPDERTHKLTELPLRIHEPQLVVDFFESVIEGKLTTSSAAKYGAAGSTSAAKDKAIAKKLPRRGFGIEKHSTGYRISLPGNTASINWLRSQPALMAITGPFGGSRQRVFAEIPSHLLAPLVEELYRTGMTMYAHAGDRSEVLKPEYSAASYWAAEPKDRWNMETSSSARAWFAERLGKGALEAGSTQELVEPDQSATVTKSKAMRRAA